MRLKAAYSRDELTALHGADRAMPDLLHDLAAPGCSKIGSNWDRCGAHLLEPIEGLDDHAHLRVVKGDFIVTGPDIEPMKFKTRPEARDWCKTHHPGSPVTEIGPGCKRASQKPPERPGR